MKFFPISVFTLIALLTACTQLTKPDGWPVTVSTDTKAVRHMQEHVKFTGSGKRLTHQENVLLTFLDNPENIAAAAGKKNIPGSHQWSAAEIYRIDPGIHISVLCENGYQQKPVYFHYEATDKTWYRVNHLDDKHSKGVPAVRLKD